MASLTQSNTCRRLWITLILGGVIMVLCWGMFFLGGYYGVVASTTLVPVIVYRTACPAMIVLTVVLVAANSECLTTKLLMKGVFICGLLTGEMWFFMRQTPEAVFLQGFQHRIADQIDPTALQSWAKTTSSALTTDSPPLTIAYSDWPDTLKSFKYGSVPLVRAFRVGALDIGYGSSLSGWGVLIFAAPDMQPPKGNMLYRLWKPGIYFYQTQN